MSNALSINVYNKPPRLGGWPIIQLTPLYTALEWGSDGSGWTDCTVTMTRLPRETMTDIAARSQGRWLVVRHYGQRIYEGVIVNAPAGQIVAQGVRALYDGMPQTRTWSHVDVTAWQTVTKETVSGVTTRDANLYDNRTEDGVLYLGLKNGTPYANATDAGAFINVLPTHHTNLWTYVTFDYEIKLPNNFLLRFGYSNRDYTSFTLATVQTGNGAVQSGSYTLSAFALRALAEISVINNSGVTYNNTTKDGNFYIIIRNVRLCTAVPPIYASTVLTSLMSDLNTANAYLANNAAQMIQATTVDLRDYGYDQASPNEILNDIVKYVDTNGTPRTVVIFADQMLMFAPDNLNARTFQIETMPDLEYSSLNLRTRITPRYKNSEGEDVYGAAQIDTRLEQLLGYSLLEIIDVDTTDSTVAASAASAALLDRAILQSVGDVTVSQIKRGGMPCFGGLVRAGDVVEIPRRNGYDLDRRQKVMATRFSYDRLSTQEQISLTFNRDTPTRLDTLLAQLDART